MSTKKCFSCNKDIPDEGEYCPYCGAKRENDVGLKARVKKIDKKIVFLALAVFLILTVVLVVILTLFNSANLKIRAEESKQNVGLEISSQAKTEKDSDIGNLTENIMAGGYVVSDSNETFIVNKDGIYLEEEGTLKSIQSGSFKNLNLHNNILYFLNTKTNCICKNANSNEEIFKPQNGEKIVDFALYKENLYILLKLDNNYNLIRFSINDFLVKDSFVFTGKKTWLNISNDVIKIFVADGTNWSIKSSSIKNEERLNFTDIVKGSNNVCDVGFLNSGFLIAENGSSKIFILDESGNRRELTLNTDKTSKILVSGHCFFVITKTNKVYWCNEDTIISHNITEDLDLSSVKAKNLALSNNNLYVICDNNVVKKYDLNSKECFEIK